MLFSDPGGFFGINCFIVLFCPAKTMLSILHSLCWNHSDSAPFRSALPPGIFGLNLGPESMWKCLTQFSISIPVYRSSSSVNLLRGKFSNGFRSGLWLCDAEPQLLLYPCSRCLAGKEICSQVVLLLQIQITLPHLVIFLPVTLTTLPEPAAVLWVCQTHCLV